MHDVILFYSKADGYYFKSSVRPYMKEHVERRYTQDAKGFKFTSGGNVLTGAGVRTGDSGKPWMCFDPTAKNRHWAMPSFVAEQMPPDFELMSSLEKLDAAYEAGLIEVTPGKAWPEPVRYLKASDGNPLGDIWAYQPGTQGMLHGSDKAIDEDVMWLGPTSPERLGYPTQKPVGLLERIVNASCQRNSPPLEVKWIPVEKRMCRG